MRKIVLFTFLLSVVMNLIACRPAGSDNPVVLMKTELGDIFVEIYLSKAPITSKNFMHYVNEKRFSDAFFYRVVRMDNQPDNDIKIEVIQGGIGFVESDLRLPPILHESTDVTGILHEDGVISMARTVPGTASSEFFICVGDQPALDFGGMRNPDGVGFAAFGKVVNGMDVVRKIHTGEADGQMLKNPVRIIEVRCLKKSETFAGDEKNQ